MGSYFLLPLFDSSLQLQKGPPYIARHKQKEQTERKFSFDCGSSYHACPYPFLPTSQEIIHWLKPVGVRVSVANFDVNYGISPFFP